jgi:hypothetical protein
MFAPETANKRPLPNISCIDRVIRNARLTGCAIVSLRRMRQIFSLSGFPATPARNFRQDLEISIRRTDL